MYLKVLNPLQLDTTQQQQAKPDYVLLLVRMQEVFRSRPVLLQLAKNALNQTSLQDLLQSANMRDE
jgi:hypothetical protein